MGRAAGFVGLLIVLAVGAYLYTRQSAGPAGGAPATKTTVDIAAVKNDLLVLANAERGQLALEGKYATLDELVAKGSIPSERTRRPLYSYSAEVNGSTGFRITATYEGPPEAGTPRRLTIDETMQIRTE
ncbi:MAG TPA: hypothetical protein VMS96_12075 [Terriglobales bacterium]|nr:hypothetical protein [Terriglobales bacterium]